MTMPIILIGLLLLSSLSPLLTWLHLWQIKEWRWDRLIEHFKNHGYGSLFSKPRLIVLALWAIYCITAQGEIVDNIHQGFFEHVMGIPAMYQPPLLLLVPLSILTLIQIGNRRQPTPHWTQKALMMLSVSFGLTALFGIALINIHEWNGPAATSILPYLTPQIAALAWFLLRPLDTFLKARVMNRAKKLRSAHLDLTVIGITGSVGKTTTKELLAHLLKDRGAIATPLHVNTEMGVAAWLTKLLASSEERVANRNVLPANRYPLIAIVEMGAYRLGEIKLLCSIAQPTMGIITSIGDQHIGLFGSRENICKAKIELFECLPHNGHAFVNMDDDMAPELIKRCQCPITRVTTGGHADVEATDIEETSTGIRFVIDGTRFDIPMHGTHHVTNCLLAIAVAEKLGMQRGDIAKRLNAFKPLERTFHVRSERGITILDDTYNSSPQSFQAALSWAKKQPHQQKILVTSGIIELGKDEAKIHKKLAAEAVKIFTTAYVTDPRILPWFQSEFGAKVSVMSDVPSKIEPGSLLVCIGRMSPSIIHRLLP